MIPSIPSPWAHNPDKQSDKRIPGLIALGLSLPPTPLSYQCADDDGTGWLKMDGMDIRRVPSPALVCIPNIFAAAPPYSTVQYVSTGKYGTYSTPT